MTRTAIGVVANAMKPDPDTIRDADNGLPL